MQHTHLSKYIKQGKGGHWLGVSAALFAREKMGAGCKMLRLGRAVLHSAHERSRQGRVVPGLWGPCRGGEAHGQEGSWLDLEKGAAADL